MENDVIEAAPPEMPMRTITERDINTSGPGPYYVYLPGFQVNDLARMTHSFGSISAGRVFPIENTRLWTQANQLPDGAARRTREIKNFFGVTTDRHAALDIPAQTTLDTLLADRVLTSHCLTVVKDFEVLDVNVEILNQMIQPVDVPERTYPSDLRAVLEQAGGMLLLRRQWLEQAAEKLETGQVLEDHRRVMDARPFLRQLWQTAITNTLIPAIDRFQEYANSILAQKEELVRDGQKKGYDQYDNTLMWLLGRKPERTALSRALEPGKGGGGIGIEEIRTLVQEVVSATGNSNGAVVEKISCPDCGEMVNTIGGGPPRICRYCRYEFRTEDRPAVIEAASTNGAAPLDTDVEELAGKILADVKKKR